MTLLHLRVLSLQRILNLTKSGGLSSVTVSANPTVTSSEAFYIHKRMHDRGKRNDAKINRDSITSLNFIGKLYLADS